MHRRRAALRAWCGGGVLAARGTAGRKAERCAGCDARYLGAYLRFGRAAWQCGCDLRGSHLRSGGLSRRMWWLRDLRRVALRQAVAPAQAARQSAARNGVGRAEWPTRRALYPVALRSGGLSRRMWRLRDMHLYSVSPSHRLKLHGNPRHVPSFGQCDMADTARAMLRPNRRSGGYRAACGGYVICGAFVLSHSVALAQAARQSAARTGVGRAEWPARYALCSGRIDA